MTRRNVPAALCLLLAIHTAPVAALGIGPLVNQTVLGQALQFSVGVRLDADEAVHGDCVGFEVHSGDSRVSPLALRWTVEPGSDAAERMLRVRSNVVIDEPVVTVRLQVACSGTRLTREFVLLVDPPAVALAQIAPQQAEVSQPPAAPPRAAEAAPPRAAEARPRRGAAAKPAAARSASAVQAAAKVPAARSRPGPPRPGAATLAAGPRLKLEAAESHVAAPPAAPSAAAPAPAAGVVAVAPAAAGSAPAVPAAASAPEAAASQPGAERLQALEASLAALTQESRNTRADMAELQSRLREAQAARYANGLVYGLGALAALLAVALGAVLWKRSASPAAPAPWWNSALQREAAASALGAPGAVGDSGAEALAETTASPMLLQQAAAVQAEATPNERYTAPVDPAVAAEELIDLEQQAEFFVVLGQDEAAIELLASHLDSGGAASPLPYLKLLEIHRRRGDREASERIRARFNRRFNAYAPEWPADPMAGRGLMDYPHVVANLQRLWSQPERALRALQASLLRRDGAEPTFDLPAYRELLFLYAVARDLAERRQEPQGVDLLLPIDTGAGAATAPATSQRAAGSALAPGVDVDVSELAPMSPDEASRRRDPGPSSYATPFDSGAIGLRH